jgi:hypothetical protein
MIALWAKIFHLPLSAFTEPFQPEVSKREDEFPRDLSTKKR